jgi:NADH:ubiquinone oxidoreductase subunit K
MTLEKFLTIGAILFFIGLYGVLSKKNSIAILMSLELMFNGINLTAVAFSRYIKPAELMPAVADVSKYLLTGQVFTVFIITVAAAEVAIGLAIIIAIYRTNQSVLITEANNLKK